MMSAEEFVPGLYPLKVGAIAIINRVLRVDNPPVSERVGGSGVVNGVEAPVDDKLEWLSDHAKRVDEFVSLQTFTAPSSALDKRLERLGIKPVEASPKADRGGGVNLEQLQWVDGERATYEALPSDHRRAVWLTLKGLTVTADQPSCNDLELLSGVSHTTCAKVLPYYRHFHGIN
jgi:hypothetical protein